MTLIYLKILAPLPLLFFAIWGLSKKLKTEKWQYILPAAHFLYTAFLTVFTFTSSNEWSMIFWFPVLVIDFPSSLLAFMIPPLLVMFGTIQWYLIGLAIDSKIEKSRLIDSRETII